MQQGDQHVQPSGDDSTSVGGDRIESSDATSLGWHSDHFRRQAEFDRLVFERAFKALAWTIGASATVIVLAGGIFTYYGLSTYSSVEAAANSVVDKAVNEIRPEVERRIRNEFETEAISALVKKEAEKRIAQEMGEIVEQAVQYEILNQKQQLAKLVASEVQRSAQAIAIEEAGRSVKRALAPRRLSETQKITLIRVLSERPKGHVALYYQTDSWEPYEYAHQLSEVFRSAGWECTVTGLSTTPPIRDLTVLAPRKADGSMSESYKLVLAAFRSAGMDSTVREESTSPESRLFWSSDPEMVTIQVGPKSSE